MSPKILGDMLGADGESQMKNLIHSHRKSLLRDEQKLQRIVLAVQFFEHRMSKRRKILEEKREASANKKFTRKSYTWREEYRNIMKEKRYRPE